MAAAGLPERRQDHLEAVARTALAMRDEIAVMAEQSGQGWLAVYSATKAGVIGLSQAAQMEVAQAGIQVTALCPAFVDTPMTEWVQGQVKPAEMIQPQDLAETVRLLLRTSRYCLIPEVVFTRPGDPSAFST